MRDWSDEEEEPSLAIYLEAVLEAFMCDAFGTPGRGL